MAVLTFYPSSVPSTVWTNPTNAYANNGTYVTHSPGKNNVSYQEYGGFNFSSIASGSTINSLTVNAEYKLDTASSVANFYLAALKSGSVSGTELDDASEPTTDTVVNQASTGSWTTADLANFTLRAGFRRGNSNTAVTLSMDYVSVTIDYTAVVNTQKALTTTASTTASTTRESAFTKVLFTVASVLGSMTRDAAIGVVYTKELIATALSSATMLLVGDYYSKYVLERKAGAGEYEQVAVIPSATQEYTDCSTLTEGTTYCYRVKRVLGTIESAWSNEQCILFSSSTNVTQKELSAISLVSGTMNRHTIKISLANMVAQPTIQRGTHRYINATVQLSNTVVRAIHRSLQATITASATALRKTKRMIAVSVFALGTMLHPVKFVKALATTISTTATRTVLAVIKHLKTLTATVVTGVTTSRFIKSIKTATVEASVTVRRGTRKALHASAHALSTVGRAIHRKKILTALSTALPTATRKTKHNMTATVSAVSTIARNIAKALSAITSTTASRTIQAVKALVETIYLTVVHNTTVALTAMKESTKSLTAVFNQTEHMTATTNKAVALTAIHSNVQEVTWTMGADPKGETIYMRLGETKTVELTVLTTAGAAADLSGATAKFRTENATADTPCTISSNKITAEIAANAFAKAGSYGYEFRIKDALNKVDSLVFGTIKVADRLVTTF